MRFLGGPKVFFRDTKHQSDFFVIQKSFFGIQNVLFSGYKKWFLTFSEVKGVSPIA